MDGPILAPAVIPPPGGLHSLRRHAELVEEQQQQALAAAGTAAGAGVGFELFYGLLKELHGLGPLLLVEWLLRDQALLGAGATVGADQGFPHLAGAGVAGG